MSETRFTLEDLRRQLPQIKKQPAPDVLATGDIVAFFQEDRQETMARMERILDAMTEEERLQPDLIGPDQRRRIAAGAGVAVLEVERFLSVFQKLRELMSQIGKMSLWKRLKLMFNFGKVPGA